MSTISLSIKSAKFTSLFFPLMLAGINILSSPNILKAQPNETAMPTTFSISTNLLGVVTLNPTLDAEYSIYKSLTIGGAVWWEVREVKDRWAEFKLTYYPLSENMNKLGVSFTGGFHTAWKKKDAKPEIIDKETSATVGVLASYSWRFLKENQLSLTPIAGIKKTFSEDYDRSPLMSIYPELKINIGYVF
ncbi:MAG: hypothetical protein J0L62_13645 [Bacteroidetes bacterium]|nr:hypothetical protein [Bacteroidota bacterium]